MMLMLLCLVCKTDFWNKWSWISFWADAFLSQNFEDVLL